MPASPDPLRPEAPPFDRVLADPSGADDSSCPGSVSARVARRQARTRTRRRRGLWALAASATVVASVAAFVGQGAEASTPAVSAATNASVAADLSASEIAARYDSAIVDIHTVLDGGAGAGSGIIIDADGTIVTNYHVVENARSIEVTVSNSSETYDATLVGADETHDIAVLQAEDADGLETVTVGDSDEVDVGDRVVAIGNASDAAGDPTVTEGAVAALAQTISVQSDYGDVDQLSDLIQTTAQLEPGNSGGPLFDATGAVIGINAAANVDRFGDVASAEGYSIPIDTVMDVVEQIESGESSETVRVGARGYLGVVLEASARVGPSRGTAGVLVGGVEDGSAADEAGIVSGDRIVAIDDQDVTSSTDVSDAISTKEPGDEITVSWLDQSGEQHQATIELGTSPIA